jgi:hypothetical protein
MNNYFKDYDARRKVNTAKFKFNLTKKYNLSIFFENEDVIRFEKDGKKYEFAKLKNGIRHLDTDDYNYNTKIVAFLKSI